MQFVIFIFLFGYTSNNVVNYSHARKRISCNKQTTKKKGKKQMSTKSKSSKGNTLVIVDPVKMTRAELIAKKQEQETASVSGSSLLLACNTVLMAKAGKPFEPEEIAIILMESGVLNSRNLEAGAKRVRSAYQSKVRSLGKSCRELPSTFIEFPECIVDLGKNGNKRTYTADPDSF